jgi:hypothetical protein
MRSGHMDPNIAQGANRCLKPFWQFGIRGLQSRKFRLAYITESQNEIRRLVVWPVIMIDDHMEVEKGES